MTILRSLQDRNFLKDTRIGPLNQLQIAEAVRIMGSTFSNGTLDTSVWATSLASGGTAVQAGGELTLETNTTPDGQANIQSNRIARYISGVSNFFRGVIQPGDTGVAGNTRRWGVFSATNGAFFEMSGTSFRVVTRKGGIDTGVDSIDFNGTAITLDANSHEWEIHYDLTGVWFIVDNTLLHYVDAAATPWSETIHLPARAENFNSGGVSTDVSLKIRKMNVMRLGAGGARAGYANINAAGTSVLKVGPGTLDRVVINKVGTTSTFTIYDNIAASGAVIALIDTASGVGTLDYRLDFNTGLTVVASATPGDITVVYE